MLIKRSMARGVKIIDIDDFEEGVVCDANGFRFPKLIETSFEVSHSVLSSRGWLEIRDWLIEEFWQEQGLIHSWDILEATGRVRAIGFHQGRLDDYEPKAVRPVLAPDYLYEHSLLIRRVTNLEEAVGIVIASRQRMFFDPAPGQIGTQLFHHSGTFYIVEPMRKNEAWVPFAIYSATRKDDSFWHHCVDAYGDSIAPDDLEQFGLMEEAPVPRSQPEVHNLVRLASEKAPVIQKRLGRAKSRDVILAIQTGYAMKDKLDSEEQSKRRDQRLAKLKASMELLEQEVAKRGLDRVVQIQPFLDSIA